MGITSIVNFIFKLLDKIEPLKKKKNPSIALIVGFIFGGVGLCIYFRTVIDILITVSISVLLAVTLNFGGVLLGATVSGLWGYFRVIASNEKFRTVEGKISIPE